VREAFNDFEPVALAVEANLDASHKAPARLDQRNPLVPSTIANRVRGARIRYWPSEDGSTFTVEAVLDASTNVPVARHRARRATVRGAPLVAGRDTSDDEKSR
jgi:hypothetical protein